MSDATVLNATEVLVNLKTATSLLEAAQTNVREAGDVFHQLTLRQIISLIVEDLRPELIDVPSTKGEIVLLRAKQMPQFGFLFWEHQKTSTRTQICFKVGNFRSTEFPVVCACCPSEMDYQKPEEGIDEAADKLWRNEKKKEFHHSLQQLCFEKGVRVLFMRRADSYTERYGESEVTITEAEDYATAMHTLYSKGSVAQLRELFAGSGH